MSRGEGGGRPTKLDDKMKAKLRTLYRNGFTDAQVAEIVDIDLSTITKWKQKYATFFTSVNDWKAVADNEIERSLYERASGYSCTEKKAQFVQDNDGGRWEYADLIRHYPPDPTSMIFWLKNRKRAEWRDRIEQSVELGLTAETLKMFLSGLPAGLKEEVVASLKNAISPDIGKKDNG